ncbi:MAG: MFS transporter [Dehalococcoidia bacterium]|nr:MFS transporter [Dehalococcoidia bacterium]
MSDVVTASPERARFYYGWWIVFASASIVFLSAGTFFYGFGLLVGPLTQEFGWSRAALSAAFSLRTEVGGIAAPLVGFTVDRVGVRRLVIGGVFVVAAGFLLLSQANSLWGFYGAVVVIAIGNTATGGATATVAIARWFHRKRGRALGLMTLGCGASGVMAIVFAWLISEFGWREALIVVGVTQLIVCTPLALSIRNKPEDMGLPVDGFGAEEEAQRTGKVTTGPAPGEGFTSKEAIRSSLFWRVAIVFALANFASTAIIVHQIPFLTESVGAFRGLCGGDGDDHDGDQPGGPSGIRQRGGRAAEAVGGGSGAAGVIGVSGAVFDGAPRLAAGLCAAAVWAGIRRDHPGEIVLAGGVLRTEGVRAIQGMALTVMTLGAFGGPILAGWLYDVSDSYRLAFLLLALAPLAAAPLILSTRPPVYTGGRAQG